MQTSRIGVDIRSYHQKLDPDRHAFAQLVLPLSGRLELDIDGSHGRLDPTHGALVAAGSWHWQCGSADNRSLIVDIDQDLPHPAWERLAGRPFTAIGAASRRLVEYMEIMTKAGRTGAPQLVHGWVPLLLDTLVLEAPQARSRLAALLAHVEASAGQPWTIEAMARFAGLSVSRLHALFRAELDASPRAWLAERRLQLACQYLAETNRPVAEIALATGFSDQSALTRAMRERLDTTPAAYRRQRRETASKER